MPLYNISIFLYINNFTTNNFYNFNLSNEFNTNYKNNLYNNYEFNSCYNNNRNMNDIKI